jgi:hypothetical protein
MQREKKPLEDTNEEGKSESKSKFETDEIAHEKENDNVDSNEREGWKVVGFGVAWFWLLTSST